MELTSGLRVGMLTLTEQAPSNNGTYWHCLCDCGASKIVRSSYLRAKTTKSCGCLVVIRLRQNRAKYDASRVMYPRRLKDTYTNMKRRCYDPRDKRYANYGGRGIRVCDEWLGSRKKFYAWAMDSGYQPGLTIDRIDVNGNYCPENCRFVNLIVQMNNTTRNRIIEFNGISDTVANWERRLGYDCGVIQSRLNHGWTVERAITQPIRKRRVQ